MTVLIPTNCCATWAMTPAMSPRRTILLPNAFLSLPIRPCSPMEPSRNTSSSMDWRKASISFSTSFAGYAKNCPPVMRRPFVLTRAPLIRAGDASEMYRGAVMEAIPTPRPTKTLPTMITAGVGEKAMIMAPPKNRASAIMMEGFLPNLSFIQPPNAAPTIAPATAMLTIVSYTCIISEKKATDASREDKPKD
ncbi:hypothetical protein U9M48_033159, partial [Paspalum notatum var. saurae]